MRQATEIEICAALTAFVCSCVRAEKVARYQYLIGSQKGRKKWLQKLDHFQHELIVDSALILSQKLSGRQIIDLLKVPGNSQAFMFSTIKGSESGMIGDLSRLVEYAWGFGCGTIICTIGRDRAAFLYFGEEEQAQFYWS